MQELLINKNTAWIGKGVGSALMKEIFYRAKNNHIHYIFSEVSYHRENHFLKNGDLES